ncbi:MAG: cell division protein FtsZ [Nanoarchaeota archaeon]|nr:cell division protein FtsZ [Nanoarchaeota archaeon]
MDDIYNREVSTPYRSEPPTQDNLSSEVKDIDRELEELLKRQITKIKVFGVGGGGNNSLNRMKEIGIKGGELIAVNTDAQDLLYTNSDQKILIGRELTNGLGAGNNPSVGEEAAKESESDIKKKLYGADMVFITCGLGGGTGTGAAPVIAALAKKQGALTIGIVTLPFTIEGKKRIENAMNGLEKLESIVDTLIVIPNDKLLELAPDLPLQTAFKISDEILTNAVKGVTELVTSSGLVNLDFADIRAVMTDGGVSLIGMGESDTGQRALEAVEKAIKNPLLDVDISNSTGALINIIGGNDMSLDECKLIVETIGNKLNSEAKLIWGAKISPDMDKVIRVLLIVTGVKSSQILGRGEELKSKKHKEIEEELGIEFFE